MFICGTKYVTRLLYQGLNGENYRHINTLAGVTNFVETRNRNQERKKGFPFKTS